MPSRTSGFPVLLPALLLCLLSAGLFSQVPVKERLTGRRLAAADLLPASTLVHLELDGQQALARAPKLSLARILENEEVKAFLHHALGFLRAGRKTVEDNLEFIIDGDQKQVRALFEGRWTLSFLGLGETRDSSGGIRYTSTVPELLLTWNLGGQEAAARNLLKFLVDLLKDEAGLQATRVTVAGQQAWHLALGRSFKLYGLVHKGYLLVATDAKALTLFMQNQDAGEAAAPLARHPLYKRVQEHLVTPASVAFGYVNVHGLLDLFSEEIPEMVRTAFKLSGLEDLQALGLSMDFHGPDIREGFYYAMKEGARLLDLYPKSYQVQAHLILPDSTGCYWSVAANWDELYDWVLQLAEGIDPYAGEVIDRGLDRIRAFLGVDLKKDLLPMLGPEVAMGVAWPGQALIPDLYLMLRLKDPQGFNALAEKVMQRYQGSLKAGRFDYLGHTIHYFGPAYLPRMHDLGIRPQVRISWTVVRGFLVVTPWPQAAKHLIRGLQEQTPRLSEKPAFHNGLASLRSEDPRRGSLQILYVDLKRLTGFVLDNLVPVLQSVLPDDLEVPVSFPWAEFPSTQAITSNLSDLMLVGHAEKDGLFGMASSPTSVVVPYMAMLGAAFFLAPAMTRRARPGGIIRAYPRPARPHRIQQPSIQTPAVSKVARGRGDLALLKEAVFSFLLVEGRMPTEAEWPSFLLAGSPRSATPYVDAKRFKGGVVQDPWGHPYHYKLLGRRAFLIVSYGRDGKPGGTGADADLQTGRKP